VKHSLLPLKVLATFSSTKLPNEFKSITKEGDCPLHSKSFRMIINTLMLYKQIEGRGTIKRKEFLQSKQCKKNKTRKTTMKNNQMHTNQRKVSNNNLANHNQLSKQEIGQAKARRRQEATLQEEEVKLRRY
jgi:hypothetical protein